MEMSILQHQQIPFQFYFSAILRDHRMKDLRDVRENLLHPPKIKKTENKE